MVFPFVTDPPWVNSTLCKSTSVPTPPLLHLAKTFELKIIFKKKNNNIFLGLTIWVIMCRRPIEDLLRGALATLTLCSVVVKEGREEAMEARARTEERIASTLIVESEVATGLDWADRGQLRQCSCVAIVAILQVKYFPLLIHGE